MKSLFYQLLGISQDLLLANKVAVVREFRIHARQSWCKCEKMTTGNCYCLRRGIAQGFPCTATITDMFFFPIRGPIIDSPTRLSGSN
jgi:hypothetical protein